MRVKAPFGNWLSRQRAEAAGWVTGCICSFDLDLPRSRRIGALGCPVHDGAVVSAEAIVAAEDHPQEAAPLLAVAGSRRDAEEAESAERDVPAAAEFLSAAARGAPSFISREAREGNKGAKGGDALDKAPACAGATGSLCPIEECLSGVFNSCKASFAAFAPSRASRETPSPSPPPSDPESQNHATARLLGVLADGLDMQAAAIRQLARGLM